MSIWSKPMNLFQTGSKLFAADHPVPNEEGLKGARQMVEPPEDCRPEDIGHCLNLRRGSSTHGFTGKRGPVRGLQAQPAGCLLTSRPPLMKSTAVLKTFLTSLKGGGLP